MRPELLLLACATGLVTWAFRVLPTKLPMHASSRQTLLRRFLAATGPAAIATLLAASLLPMLPPATALSPALPLGIAAVLAVYAWRRSVVLATLAGALAYGLGSLL
ncbi:AzlD domain-containing protein [Rhodobacter lacus]|uniref:AzlD domain-containing protein n=1 Tax=Rhodobacter lacus TaxID=1641972 RepID=A0ABW5AB35_9RHOB